MSNSCTTTLTVDGRWREPSAALTKTTTNIYPPPAETALANQAYGYFVVNLIAKEHQAVCRLVISQEKRQLHGKLHT